jgi:hypothetical protein
VNKKSQIFLKTIGRRTGSQARNDYLAPGYVPGTHEIERREVTWHQLRTTAEDLAGKIKRRRKKARND